MPEDSRTALRRRWYSRVQQLNENESQLNKQVFSLVVFDRFLPSGAVGSSSGGTSDLARSSVSKLLTGQLNQLANKYVKGVELNLDVDSYTDYRTGQSQQRTDLNVSLKKAFFDDRVVVEVGSNVGVEGQENNSQLIGNVAIEYLLNEKGTYRLRAYRKDEYQNLVEGQVIITGLGILFSK
ncbi:MAG: translocation/assembly module TamB domain-containing protein [Owenweeksia sp.]|nr:translocation/assembly module TamB domain-containing protein [Owenweeksia sp.]